MKEKKLFFGVLFIIFSFFVSNAQEKNAKISFAKDVYSFRTINAADGPAICTFEFTNVGGSDLIIKNVAGDYGLTPFEWPKKAVKPGEKGLIKARLNPDRIAGRFTKRLTITTNSNPPKIYLRITGNVIPKPESITDRYNQQMGNGQLRLKKNFFSMGKVYNTKPKTDSTEIINNSEKDIKISFFNVPKYITVKSVPEVLQPKQKGYIYITYDASKNVDANGKQIWGAQNRRINVALNGNNKDRSNYLTVRANIEEDFSSWTPEQLANAPIIHFDTLEHNFGTVQQGEIIKHNFVFKNMGNTPLIIRKVKGS